MRCVPYWHPVSVNRIDPTRGRDGDQGMAEIHKAVDTTPLSELVVVCIRAALRQSILVVIAVQVMADKQVRLVWWRSWLTQLHKTIWSVS